MTFEYCAALRPCYVKAYKYENKRPWFVQDGERKALFHGWGTFGQIVDPSPLKGGHPGGVISSTFGIVEFEDGTVDQVPVSHIRFVDNTFADYSFEEGNHDDGN